VLSTRAPSELALPGAVQQRRLADPGLAAHDERPAPLAKAVEERVEALDLGVAPQQPRG
jgi:hypothetical protein